MSTSVLCSWELTCGQLVYRPCRVKDFNNGEVIFCESNESIVMSQGMSRSAVFRLMLGLGLWLGLQRFYGTCLD